MKRRMGLMAAILAGVAMLSAAAAFAATETTNMSVSATVTNLCGIATGSMSFGSVESADPNVKDATTTVTVTCSGASPSSSSVAVGGGNNASGVQRRMLNGVANFLSYNLYSDSSRTTLINPSGNMVLGAYVTNVATGTIYGRIPSGQTATVGSYADTVVLTLTYEQ